LPSSEVFTGSTTGLIASGATVYLGSNGAQATAVQTEYLTPVVGAAVKIVVSADQAPGSGETFTYTLYQDGAATSLSGSVTGSDLGGTFFGDVPVNPGDNLSIQLVTSSGAIPAHHRYAISVSG